MKNNKIFQLMYYFYFEHALRKITLFSNKIKEIIFK